MELFISSPFENVGSKSLNNFSQSVRVLMETPVLTNLHLNTTDLKAKISKTFLDFNQIIQQFTNPGEYDFEYRSAFKGLYLFNGFFCIFLLVVIGISNYCSTDKIYYCLFFDDLIISILFLYSFLSTFFKIRIIGPFAIIIFFFLAIGTFFYQYRSSFNSPFLNRLFNKNFTIELTIALILIPFFLHFLRVIFQVIYIRIYVKFIERKYKIELAILNAEVSRIDSVIATYLRETQEN